MRRFVAGLAAVAGVVALLVLPTALAGGGTAERAPHARHVHVSRDATPATFARGAVRSSSRALTPARFATWMRPPEARLDVRPLVTGVPPSASPRLASDITRATRSRAPPA